MKKCRDENKEWSPVMTEKLVQGCVGSGYAERWNAETGAGLGAIPQGWAALACEASARLGQA